MPYAEVQITCIRRYAPGLDEIPIFIATELRPKAGSQLEGILKLKNTFHIFLQEEESGFLESRLAGVGYLPEEFDYVLPLQEDFWLDRVPDYNKLSEAIHILKTDQRVQSIRLMPSPGPHPNDELYRSSWKILGKNDSYKFTYQATIWRVDAYRSFLEQILKSASRSFRSSGLPSDHWSKYCIRANVAENLDGQAVFFDLCMGPNKLHLSIERAHSKPNAVFMAPWPYRPTAVVQGSLEPWAKEFAKREGFNLE